MSDLDQILERARSPGRFVERRHFTLSRERAIEKLRDFTLRRPGQAVLELVQAAVFAGATYIAIDARDDRLVVAWVGTPPLQEGQLTQLFDYLFADSAADGQRHLVQLAVAVNAMLREERGTVRIESGNGNAGESLRLDLNPKGAGEVGVPESALAGTYVAMERPRSWWRFWQRTAITEEQVLVEEQCRYTPVPILLNGTAPFGYRATRKIRSFHQGGEESFDEGPGGRRGSLHLRPVESSVDLVVAGVRVTTVSLPELGLVRNGARDARGMGGFQFSGVVCDDRLRKTADQSDVVRDERFAEMLQALREPSTRLARRHDPTWESPLPEPVSSNPSAGPEVLPLPASFPQLPPRLAIALARLDALDPSVPLFRIRPNTADVMAIRRAADPSRLPAPVLVLTDEQAEQLQERLGRPVGLLADAASVDLTVRTAAGTRGSTLLDGRHSEPSGRTWRALVWTAAQPQGLVEDGRVLVLVENRGLTAQMHTVALDAPGFCAVVEGDLPIGLPQSALLDLVLRYSGRLVLEDPTAPLPLRASVLAAVLRLDPAPVGVLALSTPPDWTVVSVGLQLADWARAVSTGGRLVVSEATLEALQPLEKAIAVGHLGTVEHGRMVVGVARRHNVWGALGSLADVHDQAALLVWDGPPTVGQPLSVEPFVTLHGEHDPTKLAEGAALLVALLRQRSDAGWRAERFRHRWLQALAQVWDQPAWEPVPYSGPRALAGGPTPAHSTVLSLPFDLARSGGHLPSLSFPPWADTGEVDGGWWIRCDVDGGWLGIPAALTPRECPPRVLVDTGLDRRWFADSDALPCIGVVRLEHPSKETMWPLLVRLWVEALGLAPGPSSRSWLAYAQRVLPADSLLGARLAELGDGRALDDLADEAVRTALDDLIQAGRNEPDPRSLLQAQQRVLGRTLGRAHRRGVVDV